jgi:hypothetical protein
MNSHQRMLSMWPLHPVIGGMDVDPKTGDELLLIDFALYHATIPRLAGSPRDRPLAFDGEHHLVRVKIL